MERGKFLDIVVCGPDMSGTSTQIKGIINFFEINKIKVRDLRGTEIDALFHAEKFRNFNEHSIHLSDLSKKIKKKFLSQAYGLKISSCVKNNVSTYINPNSADVWIMEEPPRRGAGQVNRNIEQNRSEYGEKIDFVSASITHSVYRIDEFLRFRKSFREENKIIIRSRSEESACYQIYDKNFFPSGISLEDYLNLPGHKFALKNSPTHIFIVCGPKDWTNGDYLELKNKRIIGRRLDDYERNTSYQVLVNKRYATDWIKNFYEKGIKKYGGEMPEITRFNIYDKEEEINIKMAEKISSLL